eukprot:4271233-Pyramimonas_sp.AAC.1
MRGHMLRRFVGPPFYGATGRVKGRACMRFDDGEDGGDGDDDDGDDGDGDADDDDGGGNGKRGERERPSSH